jgi:hypothetical protein
LSSEHLFAEVLRDQTVRAGQLLGEELGIIVMAEADRRELDAGSPPLRAVHDRRQHRVRRRRPGDPEQDFARHVGVECELGLTQLQERVLQALPAQCEPQVSARREDDVRAVREMLGEPPQIVDDLPVSKIVQVVEDQDDSGMLRQECLERLQERATQSTAAD